MKEHKKFVEYANGPSLAEINDTVTIPKTIVFGKILSPFQDRVLWSQ